MRAGLLGLLVALTLATPAAAGRVVLADPHGYLSGPRSGDPAKVALRWVRAHHDQLGLARADLRTLRVARTTRYAGGTTKVRFRQVVGGVPVFGAGIQVVLRRDGRVLTAGGDPVRGLRASRVVRPRRDGRLVWFGRRLAVHSVMRESSTALWDTVLDVRSGKVLRRVNLVRFEQALAWEHYPGAPSGGTAREVDISRWLSDPDRLFGPNVHAHTDLDNSNGDVDVAGSSGLVTPNEEVPPQAGTSDWLYPYTPVASPNGRCPAAGCIWNHLVNGSWAVNREQDATQLFYFVNAFHDHLAAPPISFGPGQGNFEGDDAINASAMDGAAVAAGRPVPLVGVNNANFSTPPDGQPGQMQMYLFENGALGPDDLVTYGPFSDVSSASDASTVYHEYTHGLTNRLVTREDGYGAMDGVQSAAIGEGTSDFYAMDKLLGEGHLSDTDQPGEVDYGFFFDGGRHMTRSQPLDCPVGAPASACPRAGTVIGGSGGYTYADFGRIWEGGTQPHFDGEIWSGTLFDLRRRLVRDHGPAEGVRRMRHLLTRALEIVTPDPSFLDLRDAMLVADTASGARERRRIWETFAARGMGASAKATPEAAFDIPPGLPAADTMGPAITIDEPAPGEVVRGEDVVVVGSAVDDAGVSSVQVNGRAAAVRDDTWTVRLQLPAGPQQLSVVGRDIEGRESTDARTVLSDRALPALVRPRLRRGVLTAGVSDDTGVAVVRLGRKAIVPDRRGRVRVRVRGRAAKVTLTDRAGRVARLTVRSRR